jgi:hypothetical protein
MFLNTLCLRNQRKKHTNRHKHYKSTCFHYKVLILVCGGLNWILDNVVPPYHVIGRRKLQAVFHRINQQNKSQADYHQVTYD